MALPPNAILVWRMPGNGHHGSVRPVRFFLKPAGFGGQEIAAPLLASLEDFEALTGGAGELSIEIDSFAQGLLDQHLSVFVVCASAIYESPQIGTFFRLAELDRRGKLIHCGWTACQAEGATRSPNYTVLVKG